MDIINYCIVKYVSQKQFFNVKKNNVNDKNDVNNDMESIEYKYTFFNEKINYRTT